MSRSRLTRSQTCRYYSGTPRWNIERSLHVKQVAHNPAKRRSQDSQGSPLPSQTTTLEDLRQNSTTSYNFEMAKTRFREWTERAAIGMRLRADDFTTQSRATFSRLGVQLNKVTGYEEIEALKRGVVEQEQRVNGSRRMAREAKKAYELAVIQRADSQHEVNDLLQRKATWTAADVARFTALVPQDHQLQQQEAQAKAVVDGAEEGVEKEFSQLMRLILARYHEEQMWSDKIRSASTYGSLVALGLNMLVFISAILIVEPWKRRRLAQTFESKIIELSRENGKRLNDSEQVLIGRIEEQTALLQVLKATLSTLSSNIEAKAINEGEVEEWPTGVQAPRSDERLWPPKRQLGLAIGVGAFTAGVLCSMLFRA